MTIRVRPFARIGEIVTSPVLDVPPGATAGTAWRALSRAFAQLEPLRASTRLVVNGEFANDATPLHDGDELALLPPFGGG
ncbi:MAG: MoaD/ThiS family protein [Candidatus Eremiobacteraeota bacterium]|nr:MoaD/ThiS family protein [Candidatus Eremiobacteraeota bacterium]